MTNGTPSSVTNIIPAQTGSEKHWSKGKGGANPSAPLPPVATAAQNQAQADVGTLRHVKEQAEAAHLAREQEEAARKEREEVVRVARERAAAARRERQLQLAREREEAKERERIAQRQKQEQEWAKEVAVTIQKVILNSFVKFEAGLTIQHVICGFEASKVLIKNLPVKAKKSEIIELFTQQGVNEQDLVILKTETVDGRQQATVLGKAADVETVALGLDGIEFRDENLEFVVCERSVEGRTMGSSNRNTYHLSISWRAPFLAMVVRYPQLETWEVLQKARNLDGRVLNGQCVRAEHEAEGYGYYGFDDDYIPPRSKVKITRIPAGTTVADIRAFAGTQDVEPYVDTSTYTSDEVFNAVNARLRSLPSSTLRTFTLDTSPRPNTTSAKAIFDSWDGAKSAHDGLKGKIFRYGFPPLRLFLSDPYRFVLTLDEKQFNAQKSQWTELCNGRDKETTVQTRTVDRAGRPKVIITLFGRDKKMVGALKVRIESMAAGQKLDSTYWHPTFKSAKGQEFLDELCEITGAYVRADWRHNCVAVSGKAEAIEAAKSLLREEVERISTEQWTIPLQRRALGFFVREGLAKMRGLLGEENVTLDVQACQIVLHGADLEEARHHLRQLMDAFMDRNAATATTSDDTLCPICYDTISQPIEISCQHIYCSSCLRHYVLSTLDNHNFPLKCMGSDATCNQPLSLPLIKKFLPPQRFEQLMEAAFTSYIDKNPETFKYCNTPDCSQVYRATTLPHELQCPSCFSEICTACHNESHVGMTCAEKRAHKDPGEQERLMEAWATDNNVKRCPSCRLWVEKTEGCNHMSCKCGAHFCWICTGVFDASRIYTHMSEAHGGYYGDPAQRANRGNGLQPRNQVPDIVEVVGGAAAVAEQMAEFRRIELQRANREQPPAAPRPVARAVPARPAAPRPVAQAVPARPAAQAVPARPAAPVATTRPPTVVADPWVDQAERRRQEQLRIWQQIQQAERQRREAEGQRRRDMERAREARQQALMREEEARRRREHEARRQFEVRRREAEESKGWCTIM